MKRIESFISSFSKPETFLIHYFPSLNSLTLIFLSLISVFGFFMLTGELTSNFRSRWFATLCFSFAPRFLTFSLWQISLRFSFIALLPFFIWLLLRLSHSKYGRHPGRIFFLLLLLGLILPSLHRMALLFPGILLAHVFVTFPFFSFWGYPRQPAARSSPSPAPARARAAYGQRCGQ